MATNAQVHKVIDRLKESLAAGSAYEGLQSVKAANRRLRTRGQLSSGYSLLGEAASLLWMAGQLSGSLDLAKTLLQDCKGDGDAACHGAATLETGAPMMAEILLAIRQQPPAGDGSTTSAAVREQAASWAEAAAAWAWRSQPYADGTEALQRAAGGVVSLLRGSAGMGAGRAAVLFARCCAAESLHTLMAEQVSPGAPECDLHVARAVLLLLAAAPQLSAGGEAHKQGRTELWQSSLNLHLAAASLLWRICEGTWKHQQAEGFDGGPLTSFCSLLLEVLRMAVKQQEEHPGQPHRGAPQQLAAVLRQTYEPALDQDPELGELLDRVESTYLGVHRQQPGMGGMLGALMAAMS